MNHVYLSHMSSMARGEGHLEQTLQNQSTRGLMMQERHVSTRQVAQNSLQRE